MISIQDEYPQDYFVTFEKEPHLLGRLTVNKGKPPSGPYFVEVDILFEESRKIFFHVGIIYGLESLEDSLEQGMQKLAKGQIQE